MPRIDQNPRPATIMPHDHATQTVSRLNRHEEDGWSYQAEPMGQDKARVAVYDEDGLVVGYL